MASDITDDTFRALINNVCGNLHELDNFIQQHGINYNDPIIVERRNHLLNQSRRHSANVLDINTQPQVRLMTNSKVIFLREGIYICH